MTVRANKPAFSIREKLKELDYAHVPYDKMPAGSVVQIISSTIINIGTSSQIPVDTTIPLSTEGYQVASVTIYPKKNNSKFMIFYTFSYDKYQNDGFTACVFRDNSVCVNTQYESTGGAPDRMSMSGIVLDSPNTNLNSITYSLRVGGENGTTWWINNNSYTTYFGGTLRHEFSVMEILQ